VRRIVNSSTGGAIYGDAATIPTPEDHLAAPMAPYGQSKLAAEGYLGLYERLHGLSSASLRYANVYGPRQDPHGEGGVVAIFCGKLVDGGRPVAFGDGLQTRDYTYVDDIVSANLAAAGSGWEGACNVGTGVETTVNELYRLCADVAGSRQQPRHVEPRAGDARRSVLDPSRAGRELGWRARTQLDEGLRLTWDSIPS
jgi:UDP-glucose 4-epimerase